MTERRSVVIDAPDRWVRVVTDATADGWDGLTNGERLGWLHADPRAPIVSVWVENVRVGRFSDELASYYHPILLALTGAGFDTWTGINVVAVEDRYVLHDYLRHEALTRWAQTQLRT